MLIEDPQKNNRALRSEKLVRETKLLNIARLAKMLVDLFGLDDQFKKVGKREGQEVEMYIPALKGYITFVLTADRQKFDCYAEAAKNPITKVEIKVKEKDILRVLSKIIRSKDNVFGLLKIAKLYLLRKVKITGSFRAALTLTKCLMIGKNRIYKEKF
jgi:hypothetical protein